MDALAAATATARPIVDLPARFMLDGATYQRGGELGFEGFDFYFAGRAGVLGDVPAEVVAAALVFFEPGTVAGAWERARKACPPAEAVSAFAGCGHVWAEAHLPEGVDHGRLAVLEGKVIASASVSSAPLFAGWRAVPEPSSPKALALHRTNVLRELRGAMHGGAVLAQGLSPLEAIMVQSPHMAGLFGWAEPHPDPGPHRAAWQRAEEGTDRAMARHLEALDDAERDELAALLAAASA
jgi:hypothetical protein